LDAWISIILLFTKCYWGNEGKDTEMGEVCRTCGKDDIRPMHSASQPEDLKERNQLGDLSIALIIILK
jgi:hypothetical protein